jgi:hypothetical protein
VSKYVCMCMHTYKGAYVHTHRHLCVYIWCLSTCVRVCIHTKVDTCIHTGTLEAIDPDVVMMQWRRGPFAEGWEQGVAAEELVESASLDRAVCVCLCA